MIFDGIWAAWKTKKLFGWLQQEPYTTPVHRSYCQIYIHHFFCCGKLCSRCFDTKRKTLLRDFEQISFWWCLELLVFFARHATSPVWKDIQMLKFGQIVDLDLIERSAPNKYVQVRRRRVSLSGWDEGVKVSSWSQLVGVVLPGVWWVVDWYQCILECGLIKGIGFAVATQRHKKRILPIAWFSTESWSPLISYQHGLETYLNLQTYCFFRISMFSLTLTILLENCGFGLWKLPFFTQGWIRGDVALPSSQELQEKVLQAEAEHRRRIADWQKRSLGALGVRGTKKGGSSSIEGFGGDKVVIGNDMTASVCDCCGYICRLSTLVMDGNGWQ